MPYDHYSHALKIQAMLKEQGDSEAVGIMEAAMAGGSTGTEILMELRYRLAQMVKQPSIPKSIVAEMRVLIREIDNTLNPFPFQKLFDLFRRTK